MSKNKAIVCTVLFAITLFGILFATACLGDGIVYRYITAVCAGMWIGNTINRFYHWLRKGE